MEKLRKTAAAKHEESHRTGKGRHPKHGRD
jgi:hypothetical protein